MIKPSLFYTLYVSICCSYVWVFYLFVVNVQPYQPGFVAPPPQPCLEETTIDIGYIFFLFYALFVGKISFFFSEQVVFDNLLL